MHDLDLRCAIALHVYAIIGLDSTHRVRVTNTQCHIITELVKCTPVCSRHISAIYSIELRCVESGWVALRIAEFLEAFRPHNVSNRGIDCVLYGYLYRSHPGCTWTRV